MTKDVNVQIGAPTGVEIPPDLWGIFLEDINDALDGGLNAEQVRNGDFEYTRLDNRSWGPLTGWQVDSPDGQIRSWVHTTDPIHPNNPTHLRLQGPVTLRNAGWDGIEVQVGGLQRLSLAARVRRGAGTIHVAVANSTGQLAESRLEVSGSVWSWYQSDLAGRKDGRGVLCLDIPDGLTVDLDVISLRPVGPGGQPLTFRPDLLATLRDLRPSFVRFPGGCLVHGVGLENVYHWKQTIGPRHTRRQMFNPWGYHQSMSIGYFEYFQLCQELGATPLPVVAAGVCCQNTMGGARAIADDDLAGYIQDILDLIEFANGPVTSTWGAKRAELGHAEPFGLRYLGLGNEDQITDEFRDRYGRIEDVIRTAHPEITIIGTVGPAPYGADFEAGWDFARQRNVAMVDEHFYRSPRWFHQHVARYDSYDRSGPKVYVGEYAAHGPQVRSALAEAALMIGFERNSDLVQLASYAPLFGRIGHSQWKPDLIYFDARRTLPSASYHVQRMFAAERGVTVHQVEVSGAAVAPIAVPGLDPGGIRLQSATGTVRFQDLVVDGTPLPDTQVSGPEAVEVASFSPTGATVEFTAERTTGSGGFAVELGAGEAGSWLRFELGGWKNQEIVVSRHAGGSADSDADPQPWSGVLPGWPVRVRIALQGPWVRLWVDGQLRHDYRYQLLPEHRVVAGAASRVTTNGGTEYVVRLVNATGSAQNTRVTLADRPGPVVGRVNLLAGARPDDGEAFEQSPVAPVETEVSGVGGVDLELAPWSFAVLVLH